MDKGVWWAIVHGVARVGHDLATELPHLLYHRMAVPPGTLLVTKTLMK